MSKEETEGMKALNQSLNDHMEICALKREVKRLRNENARLRKAGDAMFYNMTYYKSFVPDNGNIHHMIDASILGWNPKYGKTIK